ncbi:ricin-type beta-trefoil lectin domain protein [Actinomadura syzygii]|uniref:Ricin-type beta-trefoil lectin domain protein n=2 Tax=Actinomadura syzygii TaxID=1427538 RepID=A0A5D0UE64_9ACTN|nr:ricin-type beta-trefoil lectin domain protein [Actinomadura syzygii]
MRKFMMLVLMPAITMLGGISAVTSASAAPSSHLASLSLMPKSASGLCLEVADANTGNGALVTLWPCTGAANQQWNFVQGRIQSALPGNKCLDVRSGNLGDGAAINTYDCHQGDPQQWRLNGGRLVNGLNDKCLSVLANNFAAGAALVTYGCNGGPGQSWMTS